MGRAARRPLVLVCVAAALAVASDSGASAAVTVGQTGTPGDGCSPGYDMAQLTVTAGNAYFVPAMPPATALTITSWSHVAYPDPGQVLAFKAYRPVPGTSSTFSVLAKDAHTPAPGPNTFPVRIAVQAGDMIGITGLSGPLFACGFSAPGENYWDAGAGDHLPGSQVTFVSSPSGFRLNVSATVEPTNAFSIGKVKRNTRTGAATVALDLPNPGEVAATGNGVKAASDATSARSVPAGTVKVKIKAKGKKLGKLNRTGKVKLAPTITYTPTGGSPSTQSTRLRLKKTG